MTKAERLRERAATLLYWSKHIASNDSTDEGQEIARRLFNTHINVTDRARDIERGRKP